MSKTLADIKAGDFIYTIGKYSTKELILKVMNVSSIGIDNPIVCLKCSDLTKGEIVFVRFFEELKNRCTTNIVDSKNDMIGTVSTTLEDIMPNYKSLKRQFNIDQRYLRMAKIWSENSYCVRRKVGALLVKDRRIISDGYNGTPSGFPNICEYIPYQASTKSVDELETYPVEELATHSYVLHAEANAITKIAKSNNSSEDATLYVTASPCMECSKLIIQSGIKRVVYSEEYRIMDGIYLLKKANIECTYIDIDEEFDTFVKRNY